MDASQLRLDRLPHTVELRRRDGDITFGFVDQRALPHELVRRETRDWHEVVDAICSLAVRGAPAIGIAGVSALTLWVAAHDPQAAADSAFLERLDEAARRIGAARPTAVNLRWAVERARDHACATASGASGATVAGLAEALLELENQMEAEDERANRLIGMHGAALLPEGAHVLTHCNAGSLATYFYGTALGVVYSAAEQGKLERVYADETRPVGQGARLTAWELARAGVPVTLICDDMAASVMAQGLVDAVIVGADRIARNGDTANKIGTYGLAVLAREHGVPFYVAAPSSTVDLATPDGEGIVIEQRDPSEVLPEPLAGVDVLNPAFDVTPARYVTAIITENGVFTPQGLPDGI